MEHWSDHLFGDRSIQQVFEGYDDPDASYSFDLTDVVQVGDEWYLVSTSGCSCPSYDENAEIEFGPSTLDGCRDYILSEYASTDEVRDYYKDKREMTLEGIDKAAQVA
jgi:hypothetical protein